MRCPSAPLVPMKVHTERGPLRALIHTHGGLPLLVLRPGFSAWLQRRRWAMGVRHGAPGGAGGGCTWPAACCGYVWKTAIYGNIQVLQAIGMPEAYCDRATRRASDTRAAEAASRRCVQRGPELRGAPPAPRWSCFRGMPPATGLAVGAFGELLREVSLLVSGIAEKAHLSPERPGVAMGLA